MLGRVGSSTLFGAAGGNCVGAVLGGALAAALGLTAPYWVGFVVAVLVAACTWRVFDRATVGRVLDLVKRNEYKRRQAPPGVRVSRRAFGRDWRYPVTNGYRR